MRLREVKLVLEEILLTEFKRVDFGGNERHYLESYDKLLALKSNLSLLDIFNEELVTLGQIVVAKDNSNRTIISSNDYSRLVSTLNQIKERSRLLYNFVNLYIKNQDYSFSIKIPEDIKDVQKLQKVINELYIIFSDPIARLGGNIKITDYDIGSLWLDFKTFVENIDEPVENAKILVKFIGLIVISAKHILNVKKKFLEFKKTLSELKIKTTNKSETENEIKEKLKKEISEQATIVIEATKETIKEYEDSKVSEKIDIKLKITPELTNSVSAAIDKLSNLLGQGLFVTPQLKAPEETKELIPDTRQLEIPDIKELPQFIREEENKENTDDK
ncbi:MAG TPA: hypothetical protein VHP32_08620 [Ignavibacteria bacterium]|nr:hypothetical protein [Ignavibacteria bacterium]